MAFYISIMPKQKTSFVLHHDSLEVLDELTMPQRGELLTAIYHYQTGKDVGKLSQVIKIVFVNFKNQFDRDNAKYQQACETNKSNALKKYQKEPTAPIRSDSQPVAQIENKIKPITSDSDNEKVSVKDNVIESELPLAVSIEKNTVSEKKFLELFNQLKKEAFPKSSGHVSLDKNEKNNLKKLLARGISWELISKCIQEMLRTKWIIDSGNHTPKHILIDSNFNRYLNIVELKIESETTSNKNQQLLEDENDTK